MLILFGFRSIFISLPLSTVCEEREFNFLTVRLMLDVLSKYMYSYSLYIGTLQVRHWSVASRVHENQSVQLGAFSAMGVCHGEIP